jgi:AcrR family transcriptional regulator
LFSQKGYHHTNSKEITAAAGVATGSFYAYFKDKREIFIESLKVYQAKFNEQVKDYLEKHLSVCPGGLLLFLSFPPNTIDSWLAL